MKSISFIETASFVYLEFRIVVDVYVHKYTFTYKCMFMFN